MGEWWNSAGIHAVHIQEHICVSFIGSVAACTPDSVSVRAMQLPIAIGLETCINQGQPVVFRRRACACVLAADSSILTWT